MKKSCLISVIISLTVIFFIGFMLIMAATSALNTEQGRQESVTAVQTSALNSYINVRTEQQIALVNAAKNEYTERGGTLTKGGNTYTNSSSNIQWDTYFVKYCMDTANINVPEWNKSCTVFATKLHLNGKFSLEKDYLPKSGDIVFFGRKTNTLLDGQTVRANHCGIVSRVEMITEKTEINAMRISVIEGDVEGEIINGSYELLRVMLRARSLTAVMITRQPMLKHIHMTFTRVQIHVMGKSWAMERLSVTFPKVTNLFI